MQNGNQDSNELASRFGTIRSDSLAVAIPDQSNANPYAAGPLTAPLRIGSPTQAIDFCELARDVLTHVLVDLKAMQTLIERVATESLEGMSSGEVQTEIDRRLQSIKRVSRGVEFEGVRIFDGSLQLQHTAGSLSQFATVTINQANLSDTGDREVRVEVEEYASHAALSINSSSFAGGLLGDLVIELSGQFGSETLTFASGTTLREIADLITLFASQTGVTATTAGNSLDLSSTELGSDAFVHLTVVSEAPSGAFAKSITGGRTLGSDAVATINGLPAHSEGNRLFLRTRTLDLAIEVQPRQMPDDPLAKDVSVFRVTGGGVLFELPGTTMRVNVGSMLPSQMGSPFGRLYQLGTGQKFCMDRDITGALRIAKEAARRAAESNARLIAFQAIVVEPLLTLRDADRPFRSRVPQPHLKFDQPQRSKLDVAKSAPRTRKPHSSQILVQPTSVLQMGASEADIFLRR